MLIFSSQPAWFFGRFFSHFPVACGSLTHFLKLPWCLIFFYAERMRPGNSLPCFPEITAESARTLPAWEHVVLTQDLLLFLQVWRSPFLHFLHPSYKSSQRNSNCQLPPLSFGAAEFTAGTRTWDGITTLRMEREPGAWRLLNPTGFICDKDMSLQLLCLKAWIFKIAWIGNGCQPLKPSHESLLLKICIILCPKWAV